MKVSEFIKSVKDGQPFRIDFDKREVRLNGFLINDIEFEIPDNPEEKLLEYFKNYKTSVPAKKADSKYFFACNESELSTKQLVDNEPRYVARAKLEIFVLGLIVKQKWDFCGKWYWQSKTEPKLVLFKKWF